MVASLVVFTASVLASPPSGTSSLDDLLRWRWVPGQTVVYDFVDEQVIADKAANVPAIENATTTRLRIRSLATNASSSRHECRFERVQLSVSSGGDVSRLDTSEPAGRRESPAFARYRSLVGPSFQVTLDARGGVVSIEGGPEQEADRTASYAMLRRFLAVLTSWMPSEALGENQHWRRQESLPTGLVELTRDNDIRYVGARGPRLEFASTIGLKGKPTKTQNSEGETVIASLTATKPGTGQIVFDAQLGMVRSIRSSVAFEMQIARISNERNAAAVQSAQEAKATLRVDLVGLEALNQAN